MTRRWIPADAAALPDLIADWLHPCAPTGAALRVAVDGPECAAPADFAVALLEPLRARGHDCALIRADHFWRDASLRLEFGREDVDSYREWLDAGALRREVLDRLGPGGDGVYLPSLRDPATNRSTREAPRPVGPQAIAIVAGQFLLGCELPWDRTVHLRLSPSARRRRTAPEHLWTLPAHDAYDREVDPETHADLAVRLDDPRHPAVAH